MSIDGSVNLGDLNGGDTPFQIAGSLENGARINGALDLGDLGGQDNMFLLEGALEPALALPMPSVDAVGDSGSLLAGTAPWLTLPLFALSQGGTADGMQLAPFTLDASGEAGSAIFGRSVLETVEATGSLEPALALEALQLAAQASAGAVLAAQSLLLAMPTVAGGGGASLGALLAPVTLDNGVLLAGTLASAVLAAGGWTLAASALQDGSGAGAITFGLLQLDASGSTSSVNGASVRLIPLEVQGAAASGTLASAQLTVPLFDAQAGSFADAIGSATILLPAFASSAASVTLVRPITTTVVLNTRLKGVTRYQGLAANSFASFAGVQLAATADGIVALIGDTDLGAPIAASLVSGTSDLGSASRKRIEAAFIGYRSADQMEMTLITDEHHEYTYRLAPRQVGDTLHGARVKFGRGVDGRYWQWKLANLNGAGFDLASLQLSVSPLSRSV